MIYNDLYKNTRQRRRIPVRRVSNTIKPRHTNGLYPQRQHPFSEDVRDPSQSTQGGSQSPFQAPTTEESVAAQTPTFVEAPSTTSTEATRQKNDHLVDKQVDWEAIAHQTRAEMDGFRQRQQRRADEAIESEQARLLKAFLPIADNLQRALQYEEQSDMTLREGVELVLRQMQQTLEKEGVSAIETTGQAFDPARHEAVALTSAPVKTDTIVDEVETGYTRNDKLLRPAKVIVAR